MPANNPVSGERLEDLESALVRRLPLIIDEVGRLLSGDWPDYSQFLTDESEDVVGAAEAAIRRLVTVAEQGLSGPAQHALPDSAAQDALFEEIGRLQWREGRELTTLLSAYQVGARVAWHHVSATALETGVPPQVLAALAEAVFLFVDQLSSSSARGYVMEQQEAAITRERLRDELVELLLSDRSDTAAVRAAAARAGWLWPKHSAIIFVDPDNPVGRMVLSRLDGSCLPVRRRGLLGAIIPDPSGPGRRQRLTASLRGAKAVLGPEVSPEDLPASLHVAEIAVRLQRGGVLAEDPVFVDEHLDAIIVHRDDRLLTALREQCLAPLDGLPPAVRQRLAETLTAWLRHMGDRHAVAAELHIHPQTVRYRLTQLHELFGPALDDPASRSRLVLALEWGSPDLTP